MDVIEAGKRYARIGWHLVPCVGKVPQGEGWQLRATCQEDIIGRHLTFFGADGVGILLGQTSGVIDVEFDTPSGEAALQRHFEKHGEAPAPTWRSSRSVHRLYKWTPDLPEKAVFSVDGIEIRTGNGKAAQSVLPPSGEREWLTDPETPIVEMPGLGELIARYNAAKTPPTQRDYDGDGEPLDVDFWLRDRGMKVLSKDVKDGVSRWFIDCPGIAKHTGKNAPTDCVVTQEANGRLGGHCFHQSCGMGSWESLRDAIGRPRQDHFARNLPLVDFREFDARNEDDRDDEEFCLSMVPNGGLLRDIFEFYNENAYRRSSVMGLAVAVSLCQTAFGRRISSYTDLRTNDYNVILAATGSGKEACESTITKILAAADETDSFILPPDVQSGNGLMKAISHNPCSIWVCDEFGKILQAVLDKKGNKHIKDVGVHLLKLYGKSNGIYGGAAHSDGIRNRVVQPHLCVLGLTTSSTIFDAVSSDNVADGLLGRIAFWPVQERPTPDEDRRIATPSEALTAKMNQWLSWVRQHVIETNRIAPKTEVLNFSQEAKRRWNGHNKAIDERMRGESEGRAAVWARVAARTMKLALVHRCARLETDPSSTNWDFVFVEVEDVNWAVKLSNWLAVITCGLVREHTVDRGLADAKRILEAALNSTGQAFTRDILRTYRSITAGDLHAAAKDLGLTLEKTSTGGRPRTFYRR